MNNYDKILQDMLSVQRTMVRMIAKTSAELSFVLAYLVAKGYFSADELKQLDLAVAEKMKPTASELERADSERLLDFLRKFEGPVQ